jgi:hypothetical protein
MAPDICTLIEVCNHRPSEWQPRRYRVDGWVKLVELEHDPDNLVHQIILEDYAEQGLSAPFYRLQWCSREEADGVVGYGISGGVFPLSDVRLVGGTAWEPERIDAARQIALRNAALSAWIDVPVNGPTVTRFVEDRKQRLHS